MTIDPTLQRTFGTLLSVVTACAVWKFFPNSPDWVMATLRDLLMVGAGGVAGAMHFTKPGDIKPINGPPANEVGPL